MGNACTRNLKELCGEIQSINNKADYHYLIHRCNNIKVSLSPPPLIGSIGLPRCNTCMCYASLSLWAVVQSCRTYQERYNLLFLSLLFLLFSLSYLSSFKFPDP